MQHVSLTLVFNKSATLSVIVSERDLFFTRPIMDKYFHDILLSQHMLDAAKCIADYNVVFQQDSAPDELQVVRLNKSSQRLVEVWQCINIAFE